jgi:hypothetical protein
MDFSSMSDGELRRAHAMFLADPQSFANNPSYMHAIVQEHARRFSPGNVEADLDAASTPIIQDPMAGPRLGPERRRSRADAAVDATTGGQLYTPSENVDAMDVATPPTRRALDEAMGPTPDGLPRGYGEWSAGMAVASGDKPRAERLADADAFDARVDRQAAAYNQSTGMPQPSGLAGTDGYRDWSGWNPGDPLPGAPRMGPTELESARAEQNASRLDAIEAKYGPQARMIAERGDAAGVTDYDAVKTPREMQKNAYRREQEMAARMQGAERGADGSFLSPARSDIRAQDERQATSNKAFRAKVAAAPKSAQDPRMQQWIAQSMLAGGQPTGGRFGSKAITNALMTLPEDQQNASLRYMLPGGQLAAAVDAQNMQNANDVIKRFMTSGAAAGMNNPLAQAQMEQMNREKGIARADALIAKYPKGWDGMYNPADVAEVRNAVEKQHPGYGDAAVAHLRVRPTAPPQPAAGVAPGSVPAV